MHRTGDATAAARATTRWPPPPSGASCPQWRIGSGPTPRSDRPGDGKAGRCAQARCFSGRHRLRARVRCAPRPATCRRAVTGCRSGSALGPEETVAASRGALPPSRSRLQPRCLPRTMPLERARRPMSVSGALPIPSHPPRGSSGDCPAHGPTMLVPRYRTGALGLLPLPRPPNSARSCRGSRRHG